ncbi:MAG: phosphotransferase [Gammaproteobacteria bacterium]|nr:phosphotransferase [Gammaproteobacteria bacterium]
MLEARLAALVPHWNLADITDLEPLARGLSNHNVAFRYRGAAYVLRMGRADFHANPAEAEVWEGRPVSLPRLIAADWRCGDLLTARIECPCLAETKPTLDDLGEFLTTLHAALPERLCRDYPLDRIMRSADGLPVWIARRVNRLQALDHVQESCHNDLNSWNILVHGDTVREWMALDWEWAGNGSRLFDAVNLALFLGFDIDDAERLAVRCGYMDTARYGPFELMVERYWLREYCFAASHLKTASNAQSTYLQAQLDTCLSALKCLQ